MSIIDVASTDLCVRAVQTLMHFLWQGMLLAVVVAVVNGLCHRRSASLRYGVSFGALLIMVACLAATFLLVPPSQVADVDARSLVQDPALEGVRDSGDSLSTATAPVATRVADLSHSSTVPGDAPDAAGTNVSSTGQSESALWRLASPYVVTFYVVGVLLMLARLLLAIGGGERLRRCSFPVKDREILECLATKVTELGMRVVPTIAKCERVAAPIIVGVFKPTILLPVAILSELSPSQIEAILTHELAHIRRWDHVANLLQRIVESLLFFHPAVWYVSRCVSRERENCCDDMVLATGAEATGYAELLVRIAEMTQFQRPAPAAALAASGAHPTKLRERVLRVLGATIDTPVRVTRVGSAVAAVLVGIVAVELLCLQASDGTNDALSDFNFEDPPAAYEKEIRAADADQRIKAGPLRFTFSGLTRHRDGTLEASLGLKNGYEIVSFRLFDHSTRKFFHDSAWQLNPGNAPSSRKFAVVRDGETDRVRIHETGGQLPATIDVWMRIVENGRGSRILIPAKEGAAVKCGDSQIVVTSLLAGSMSGRGSRSGKMIWDVENPRDTDWNTTVDLENKGEVLRGRHHLVAVAKDGWRHAMDHKHFLDFTMRRHEYVRLDVRLDQIDHLELIPFKNRHKFFFGGVDVPTKDLSKNTGEIGRVANSAGEGVGGAKLEFARRESVVGENGKSTLRIKILAERTSRPDGSYDIPRLPGVEQFQVFVFADGYYPFDRFHFNIEGFVDQQGRTRILSRDDGLSRTIHLVRPAVIAGKVIGPDGKPLAGAPLSISTYCDLEHMSCSTGNHMRAITDDDGLFRFEQVPPGEIVLYYPWAGPNRLEVRDGKWSKWTKPSQTYPSPPTEGPCWVKVFDVVENQQFDEVVVDLSKSTCVLEGRVTDRRGQAVKGVNVNPLWKRRGGYYSVHGMDALPAISTDDEGRYHITGLPPGEVHVGVHSKNPKIEIEPVAVRLHVGTSTRRDLRVRVDQ